MKKLLVVFNPEKPNTQKFIVKLKKWCRKKSLSVCILPSTVDKFPKTDLCITFGGDGTLLKIAPKLSKIDVPVLGINLGSLGFLTETTPIHLFNILNKVLSGKYYTDMRSLLEIKIGQKKHLCLNDCVLHSGTSGRVIVLRVSVNNHCLGTYTGDGMIVSTPTGSTAYSLTAQGSIVHPEVPAMIISPICPIKISQKPVIVSTKSVIKIEVPVYKSNKTIFVILDGQKKFLIAQRDEIVITEAKEKLTLIHTAKYNYYDLIRTKFDW